MEKFLKFSIILSAVDKMSSAVGQAVSKAQASLLKLEKSANFKAFDEAGNKALIAGGIMATGISLAVHAAEESQVAQAKLEQVFRSMGETTGKAAKQAEEYASALSVQIGVEDEAIMAAQTKLATFAAVSNETARMSGIFDRATKAAFDLSAAGFGDAASTSVQLGKALQDPVKGITALARAGVTFTEQEKEKIKMLVASGRQLEAQNMILASVEKQVGGVAEAGASESQKMKIAFGELAESFGKALLPMLEVFVKKMTNVINVIGKFIEEHPGVAKAILFITTALLTFGVAVKTVTTVVKIMNAVLALNPIIAIAMAIIAIAIAIVVYWEEVKVWFQKFLDWFRKWGKWILIPIGPMIWISLMVIAYWDKVKAFFSNFFTNLRNMWNGFVDFIFSIPHRMWQAGVNIVKSIWDGMKSVWAGMVAWFEGGIQKIRDYLPFSPAKRGPLRDIHRLKLVETIAMSIKPNKLSEAMQRTTQVAKNVMMNTAASPVSGGSSTVINANRSSAGGYNINYSPVINITGGSASDKESFSQMLRKHQDELVRMFRDIHDRQNRTKFA